jgi:hypothetical protein
MRAQTEVSIVSAGVARVRSVDFLEWRYLSCFHRYMGQINLSGAIHHAIAVVIAATSLLGCGSGPCTAIGCLSYLRIALNLPSGAEEAVISITYDGEERVCSPGAENPCRSGFQPDYDKDAPILIRDTPEKIVVTVVIDGVSKSETLRPSYVEEQPNGASCPPTCRSARESVTF